MAFTYPRLNSAFRLLMQQPGIPLITMGVGYLHHCSHFITCHSVPALSTGKGAVPRRHRRGAHLPHSGHWARRWINHEVCDAWPVRCQTYGYLPSRRASPPLGQYQIILLGDRGTIGVNNLPRVVARQYTGRESNSRPYDHKSDALAITLPSHHRLCLYAGIMCN